MHPATSTNLIAARIQRQLNTLDWDFPEYLPGSSKAIHWYPGTFPAELPFTLIQALSKPDDVIMDPYGGVGTTALEALRLGRRAWLVEMNPIAVLASYVSGCLILLKSVNDLYPQVVLNLVRETLNVGKSSISGSRLVHDESFEQTCDALLTNLVNPSPSQFIEKFFEKDPNWEKLSVWIEKSTLDDLKDIFENIKNSSNSSLVKLLGLTMLSGSLRPLSSQIKSWGHIADNVRPKEFDKKLAFAGCMRWLNRTASIIKNTHILTDTALPTDQFRFWVSNYNWSDVNALNVAPETKIKAIITSPPYADAIDYIFAQRLSLYLIGCEDNDILSMSGNEIGARRKRAKSTSKSQWAEDLVNAITIQTSYLDKESFISLVLPHKEAGRDIGALSLEDYLTKNSWVKAFEIDRSIRQLRTRQSWTSIKRETIQIYNN